MARTNKFATQNLNHIYGKKEPRPPPPDNGIRARTSAAAAAAAASHGGMLVLRPPLKQPPAFKTTTTAAFTNDAPPAPVSGVESAEAGKLNESEDGGSNPASPETHTPHSDSISLRPNRYTPPAAREKMNSIANPFQTPDAKEVVKAEPFRPPHLRGGFEVGPPKEHSSPTPSQDTFHRCHRDDRGGVGGSFSRQNHSSSPAYSRPTNYDLQIIRPGSGGSDIHNNRYRGREGLERQMTPPYWGEGHPNYALHHHRQEGFPRRNYNNNNINSNNHRFKGGGDGYGYGGPRRSMNPSMGAGEATNNSGGEHYSKMGRDGAHRYTSGGYDAVASRPRSSGYAARSDSMPNFYNGLSSPIPHERAVHQDFGPHGRYHYEMHNVDGGYYRPTSRGYGGHAAGRSMASSDKMASRPHKYNGSMSPVSCNKMDSDNFSNRTHGPYHVQGSFSPYEEVDSYRIRGVVNNGESNVEGEHQKVAWDSSTEYNLLNLESSEVLSKSDPRLNADQRFYVQGRRQYYTEEEKRVEDAREEIMDQGQLAQGISVPKRQDQGVPQEMREEVANDILNREVNFESFNPHIAFQESSVQFKEEHNPPNVDSGLKEQDKFADRFASSKITANRTHRPFQNDSASSMRPPNFHAGRDAGPQLNSYASRSSAMSWRRDPNEMRNGSSRRFSTQYGDNNYRPGSRDSTGSDRYQF